MSTISVWFASRRLDDEEEQVEAHVLGDDLLLQADNGVVLLLDTRELMKLIMGAPE